MKRLLTLVLLLTAATATAHTWLTQDTVDRMLERMASARAELNAKESEPDAGALYELAEAASGLATLMNEEFAAHGAEQKDLLLSAIEGAEAQGVEILWSGSHQRFFYDGEAYRQYVSMDKRGEQDAEARYFLIETDFYLGDTEEEASLRARIAEKEAFLERYPSFRERARVMLFLGIDHRDLWRLCRLHAESSCAEAQLAKASARFKAVQDANSDSEIGEVAGRLLDRLEAEREAGPAADAG